MIDTSILQSPSILQLLRLQQFSQSPQSAQADEQTTTQQTSLPSPAAQVPQPTPQQVQQQQSQLQQTQQDQQNALSDNSQQQSQADTDINSPGGAYSAQQPGPATQGFLNGFLSNFQPQTQARQQLTQLMQNMPQYQQPGFFQKLEAGLLSVGAHNPAVGQAYLDEPYNRAMNQWKNQAAVAQQAASDENYTNNLNRQLITFGAGNQEKYDALAQQKQIADQKAQIQQQRADVYSFRYQNPDWKSTVSDQGELVLYNPKDPTQIHHTGITTDAMTPDMKFEMAKDSQDAAMARTQVQQGGANQRNAATIEGANSRAGESNSLKGWTFIQDKDSNWMRANQDTGQVIPVGNIPQGATKPATAAKPPSTVPTTTETDTTRPSAWYERWFEGAGPTVTTKSIVSTKTPDNQPVQQAAPISDTERATATTALTNAKQPITDANIAEIVRQLRAKSGGS
jgi:hypothetical protein